MILAYKTYAKENLLTITVKIEQRIVVEAVAFLRFSQGFTQTDGTRSYDTKHSISVKFNLFELASLGAAFLYASKNDGNSTYVKYSDSAKYNAQGSEKKRVVLDKRYLTVNIQDRFIGIRFTRYEMEAIGEDIKQMVRVCNDYLWNHSSKEH